MSQNPIQPKNAIPSQLPQFQQHCIMSWFSPAETLRLPVPLFFTMATCYPNGNEGVLHSITHTNLTSTATVSKKRIKHGLLLNSDLMSCQMTQDEKTGDQSFFFTCLLVSSSAGCLGPRRVMIK